MGSRMKATLAIAVAMTLCSAARAQKPPETGGPNVSPASLAALVHGMTQGQVEERLSARGNHQFTAAFPNATVRCVSYCRDDVYGQYYLVFTNDHLAAVSTPPPFEMRRTRYRGSWFNRRVLGNPEDRVKAVLQANDLIGPRLTEALTPKAPAVPPVDPGLTAAYLASQTGADKSHQDRRAREFAALRARLDPYALDLGSGMASIEERLGKVQVREAFGPGREIRYYGSPEHGLTGSRELVWLAIVYEDGQVVRVFSHDFVDHERIRPLEERLARPGR